MSLQNSQSDENVRPLVFVVEDETLVALNLEDMLTDLGCTVLGPAMKLDAARQFLVDGFAADLAILDVNIGGDPVFPIAEVLRDRGVPIVFATGYGRAGLPDAWSQSAVLQKPYSFADVETIVGRISKSL